MNNKTDKETEKSMDDYISEIEKAHYIYCDLIRQRDGAKSDVLKQLLNEELIEYCLLSESVWNLICLQNENLEKKRERHSMCLKNTVELIKNIEDKKRALHMINYAQHICSEFETFEKMDLLIMKLTVKNYIDAIDRNFKNWSKFIENLTEVILDSVLEEVPVISETKNLFENVKKVAELMNEFEDNATDYSNIDKELYKIEAHILVMQTVRILNEDSINVLKKNCKENLVD